MPASPPAQAAATKLNSALDCSGLSANQELWGQGEGSGFSSSLSWLSLLWRCFSSEGTQGAPEPLGKMHSS